MLTADGLVDAVQQAAIQRTWVERDFVTRRRDTVLLESWHIFCDAVKFTSRYVFWLRDTPGERGAGEIEPADILQHIGELIDRLQLVTVLPGQSNVWRSQAHGLDPIPHTASRLGTVPKDRARIGNRMSPPGIPLFYGADDPTTAIREVANGSDAEHVTTAKFHLSTEATVVDFTLLPPVPSLFDPSQGHLRRQLIFLNSFVDQLSTWMRPPAILAPLRVLCSTGPASFNGQSEKRTGIEHPPTKAFARTTMRCRRSGNRS